MSLAAINMWNTIADGLWEWKWWKRFEAHLIGIGLDIVTAYVYFGFGFGFSESQNRCLCELKGAFWILNGNEL